EAHGHDAVAQRGEVADVHPGESVAEGEAREEQAGEDDEAGEAVREDRRAVRLVSADRGEGRVLLDASEALGGGGHAVQLGAVDQALDLAAAGGTKQL